MKLTKSTIGIIAILLAITAFLMFKLLKKDVANGPQPYEALIQPFDQQPGNSAEKDASALEKGDVIVVFPEGHSWSETERTSYLILKLRLEKKDVDKLLEPVTKDIENSDDKEIGPQKETVRARKYRIRTEDLGFDLQKFWDNPVQPYPDQVFDATLIEEKT